MYRNGDEKSLSERPILPGEIGTVLTALLVGVFLFGDVLYAGGTIDSPQDEAVIEFRESGVDLFGWGLELGGGFRGEIDVNRAGGSRADIVRLSPRRTNAAAGQLLGISRMLDAGPYRGKDLYIAAASAAAGGATAMVRVTAVGPTGPLTDVQLHHGSERAGWETGEDVLSVPANAVAIVVTCSVQGTSGDVYFEPIRLAIGRYSPHAIESFQVLSRALAE